MALLTLIGLALQVDSRDMPPHMLSAFLFVPCSCLQVLAHPDDLMLMCAICRAGTCFRSCCSSCSCQQL